NKGSHRQSSWPEGRGRSPRGTVAAAGIPRAVFPVPPGPVSGPGVHLSLSVPRCHPWGAHPESWIVDCRCLPPGPLSKLLPAGVTTKNRNGAVSFLASSYCDTSGAERHARGKACGVFRAPCPRCKGRLRRDYLSDKQWIVLISAGTVQASMQLHRYRGTPYGGSAGPTDGSSAESTCHLGQPQIGRDT